MSFKMSDTAQTLKVFNLRADTREFIGAGDAYIPPHTGLPANCTLIAPPIIPVDNVAIFDTKNETWSLTEDHRSKTVYNINTGQATIITAPGPLPADVVTVAPSGPYDKWNGSEWVKDEDAERLAQQAEAAAKQKQLVDSAREYIGEWQSELMLGSISDENKVKLQQWLDYIQALKVVDLASPEWPAPPAG